VAEERRNISFFFSIEWCTRRRGDKGRGIVVCRIEKEKREKKE